MTRTIITLFIICLISSIYGQSVIFPDYIYQSNIRFPEVYRVGSDQTNNIIELNSNQTLLFQFDDMDQDVKNYSYTVIHCDPTWQPSALVFMQYMQGFESYNIFDYHFSQNTTQKYTHYEFTFPNEYMKPIISGNFIMKVFNTDDPDEIVFTRRFMVVEPLVDIKGSLQYARRVDLRNTHQELSFTVSTANVMVQDYKNDFTVNIIQNNRWDNAVIDLQPQFISNNEVNYNYSNGETSFPGGNQYRFIDLKTLQMIVEPISDVKFQDGAYHIRLRDEIIRNYKNYQSRADINGRFAVYNQDAFSNKIDPDYAYLYFTLPEDYAFAGKDVYLIGGFTFGALLDSYKMNYDNIRHVYYLSVPFKQGYYNYMYAIVDKETGKGDVTPIEGSYAQTENDYTVMVYVRRPGDICQKLLGVQYFNSIEGN